MDSTATALEAIKSRAPSFIDNVISEDVRWGITQTCRLGAGSSRNGRTMGQLYHKTWQCIVAAVTCTYTPLYGFYCLCESCTVLSCTL